LLKAQEFNLPTAGEGRMPQVFGLYRVLSEGAATNTGVTVIIRIVIDIERVSTKDTTDEDATSARRQVPAPSVLLRVEADAGFPVVVEGLHSLLDGERELVVWLPKAFIFVDLDDNFVDLGDNESALTIQLVPELGLGSGQLSSWNHPNGPFF